MGVNAQQNQYYESLFRRTTASYRAKIDKENIKKSQTTRKSSKSPKPITSNQASIKNNKILYERNHLETSSSSYDVLSSKGNSQQHQRTYKTQTDKRKIDIDIIKGLIEEKLTQVLRDKFSSQVSENSHSSISKKKPIIKSIVEDVLKEKLTNLRYSEKESLNISEPGSLRSILEDIVEQILQEKISNLGNKDGNEFMKNLEQDLQEKLNLSKETTKHLQTESLIQYNVNKSLNSNALVEELLAYEDPRNKGDKLKSNTNKGISSKSVGGIKRLQRSPRRKPEWQDPSQHDNILDKPQKPLRSRSPAPSSSARSGRSKCSSSVLIPRSTSQGRHNKPHSDPVALYQYYKNEWEYFRKQIPGETPHSRLRWHIRQRLLDPE